MQSLLEHAVLGLLRQQPRSGYDLRKIFAATPIGMFSDSPGAIYPALRRLEQRGWIRGTIQERGSLRRRRLFRPTPAGARAFRRLQEKPITRDELPHLDGLMLRFAFMDDSLGAAAAVAFLKSLAAELDAYIPTLRAHLVPGMPLSGQLALEQGIGGYEHVRRWTQAAIARYRDPLKGGQ
jgi:DNA-binding PadR family transcriptional regulator